MTAIWVIIPAAGFGKRFGSDTPKQYQSLLNSTVLEQTISCFCARDDISGIVVCVADNDTKAETLVSEKVFITTGGAERSDSVAKGLDFLQGKAKPGDLIAVHDAARPCVRQGDLTAVFEAANKSENGALLVLPSFNTLKQVESGKIKTIDRKQIYQALTPQVFRFDLLQKALQHAQDNAIAITDDASAVEQLGLAPEIVIGHSDNIKITEAGDLALAEFYLKQQAEEAS